MFHTKKYMRFIAILTLLSCSCSLLAMKIPKEVLIRAQLGIVMAQRLRNEPEKFEFKKSKKTEIIKEHDLEITKNPNFQKAPDSIIPESIKVFNSPYFLRFSLLINENTMAFAETFFGIDPELNISFDRIVARIQIFDIQTGNIIKEIATGTEPTVMVKWGKNFIVSGDKKGNIKIWDITKDPDSACINTINVATKPILCLKNITENTFVFYSLSPKNEDIILIKFLNVENINKPQLSTTTIFAPHNFKRYGIEFKGNGDGIFWNNEGKIYVLDGKKIKQGESYFFNKSRIFKAFSGLSAFKKISKEKYILGFKDGSTEICDLKTTLKHRSPRDSLDDSLSIPENQHVIDFLNLPYSNAIVCITPKLIKFLDPKTGKWIYQIDCHKFFKKTKDAISSIFYAANKIFVITEEGFIITCNCATKDMNYLFKNLNISNDKEAFKDLDFKFKYNYDTEN